MTILTGFIIKFPLNIRNIYSFLFNSVRSYSFTYSERKKNYHEQKYMRKILQNTNGCVLFDPSKQLEYLTSPKIFSENNEIISNIVSNTVKIFQQNPNDRKSNKELLASLNEQCIKNYKSWPINEQLFALDALHFIQTDLRFYKPVIGEYLNDFCALENGHALQILYYVAWSKLQLNDTEEAIVIKRLEEVINKLTLDEVSFYSLALIKGGCQVKNVDLEKSLINCLMKNNLKNHDDIAVTGIIKAIRRFSIVDYFDELKNLQKKLVPFAKSANYQSLTHIAQLGVKQRVFNQELIDVIIRRFLNNLDKLRIKDVERVLLTIATFNYKLDNINLKEFCDKVQEYLLMSYDTRFPESIIRCTAYLAIFGVVDLKLVNWALHSETVDKVLSKWENKDEHNLLIIDSYAKINLASIYKGNKLIDKLCAELMMKVCEFDVAGQKSERENDIYDVLQENGIHCIMTRPIPYIPFPCIFFVYNISTHKTVQIVNGCSDGSILQASDLHKNNPNLIAIAMFSCSQRQRIYNSSRYNGIFQLKIDQLKILGFKTIIIQKTMWNKYKTQSAKRRHLAIELCRNDVFALNKLENLVYKNNKKSS